MTKSEAKKQTKQIDKQKNYIIAKKEKLQHSCHAYPQDEEQ